MTQINESYVGYYQVKIMDYLEENETTLHKKLLESNELEEFAEKRAIKYVTQLVESENPDLEKEVFYKQMMTF